MTKYSFKEANDFSENEIILFKKILIKAGEVSEYSFTGLIEKNPKILILGNTEKIDGIGALKIPNKAYKEKVFALSNSKKDSSEYNFELGWVVSLSSGNGNKIVELITDFEKNIYATVREKNEIMIHLLKKYGFQQAGFSFKSNRGNYQIVLFTK
jgi:hypothetical protein